MKRALITTLTVLAMASTAKALEPGACSTAVQEAWGFQLGEWAIEAEPGPEEQFVTSEISLELDDCLLSERIWIDPDGQSGPAGPQIAATVSTAFDSEAESWVQFWVDRTGGAHVFRGTPRTPTFTLTTDVSGSEDLTRFRTIYRLVSTDHFWTDFQSTSDGGQSWVSIAKFDYIRRDPS